MHTVFQSMHRRYVVLNNNPEELVTVFQSMHQNYVVNSSLRINFAYSVLINASDVCGVKQQFFKRKNLCIQCSN